ncbi:hypothetical protein BH11CYA1_BH11CYA1_36250 [soil metagenome]
MEHQLITEKQVAQRFPFSKSWLQKARMTGTGPEYIKIRARVFYKIDAVEEYLSAQPTCNSTAEYDTNQKARLRNKASATQGAH